MDNWIRYKDFIARIEYRNSDDCFVGEVSEPYGRIIFGGKNVDELHKNMAIACEGHLSNLEALRGK